MAKYETSKSNKLKQNAKDIEKLQTNQKNEKGTFERNKVEQQKNLVKQQNTILTKEQKIQGNERAKAQKDFKDGLKQQKVDLQKKQKETKASKDDIKKQDKEYLNTAELHDMLFNQKQAQQKLHLDYNKKNQQAEETFLGNKELMEKKT